MIIEIHKFIHINSDFEIIKTIKDLVLIFTAIVTSFVAIKGLNAWLKKDQHEDLKNIYAILKIIDQDIKNYRSRFKQYYFDPKKETLIDASINWYNNLFNKILEDIKKLECYVYKIEFSSDEIYDENIIESLYKILHDLKSATSRKIEFEKNNSYRENLEENERISKILYNDSDKDDEINIKMQKMISKIRCVLKK